MKNIFIVLFGVLGVSFSSIFVKFTDAPSSVLAFYRNAFAFLILLPVVITKYRSEILSLNKKDIAICFLSGVFLAFHFITFFESIRFTSVASSTVLVNLEVVFVALISALFYKEKVPLSGIISIGTAIAGSAVIAYSDNSVGANIIYGDFLAVLGAAFMCAYTVIGKMQRKKISSTAYTFIVYMSSALTLLTFCTVTKVPVKGYGIIDYGMAFMMTLFCTFMGHSLFSYSLKYLPAVFISAAKLGEPVFATILAAMIFGQLPSLAQITGGIMIITGLGVYVLNSGKSETKLR